ncbi:hypothetical protein [Mycolicibacterium mageritense]|uniref:hypothetical protein n=1 Tax=Mycolicibacterium mageritense TaxID=53462 RepID=UPI0011D42C8B|nr:hypothetical protein [Mycolicibacterium mageritense]TXI53495.1 MAG: hypothetical protein E6Q55_34995 [Mycolicibacterium mageritense]
MRDHEFDLAFHLLDDAVHRMHTRRYGTTRIADHDFGSVLLTSVHRYTRAAGHHLTLFAADSRGQMAVVDVRAESLRSEPSLHIRSVRAAHLSFRADPDTCTFRARGHHHYTLSTETGCAAWSLTIDDQPTTTHGSIDAAITEVLAHEPTAHQQPVRSRR